MGNTDHISQSYRRTGVSSNGMGVEVSIIKEMISEMELGPMEINATNKQLEDSMRTEMESRNLVCDQLERTLHLAASFVELVYHDCSFPEKKNAALLNWYFFYVDDKAPKDPIPFRAFQQRFLSGEPQLNPVLDALVDALMRTWDLFDPLCANSIIAFTFEFVTSTSMQADVEKLSLSRGAQRFSWFFRERSGVPTSYTLFMFAKSTQIDIMEYFQAIADMNFWMCLVNDILSFHKEELAGETANYVHTRAYMEDKAPLKVLAEMVEEVRVSRNSIHNALSQSPRALRIWRAFEHGYIVWHLTQERYKLIDFDL